MTDRSARTPSEQCCSRWVTAPKFKRSMDFGPSPFIIGQVSTSCFGRHTMFKKSFFSDFFKVTSIFGVAIGLVACGGGSTSETQDCSGASRTPLGNKQYTLVANRNTSSVTVYAVNSTNGALNEISGSPFPVTGTNSEPFGVAVNPAATLAFVSNWGNGNVSVFRIDASNGRLNEVEGSPFSSADGSTSSWQVLISPSGKFAYKLNNSTNSISVFAINNCSGRMTEIAASPFRVGSAVNLQEMAMTANGERLYVVAANTSDLYGYQVNTQSGELIEVSGNPYVISGSYTDWRNQVVLPGPTHIAINPSGTFLYTANVRTKAVSGYAISASGALTEINGSPFEVNNGNYLQQVVFNSAGNGIYVLDANNDRVYGYQTDAQTGSLTPMPGSPFGVEPSPTSAVLDITGNYLYITTANSGNTVLGYSISSSDGSLSAVSGSPYAVPNRFPWRITVAKP